MPNDVETVAAYLAAQPEPARKVLTRVRSVIRKALPKAEESISYKMPTYKLEGVPVLYFAGWKQHFSLYPATAHVIEALGDALAPYRVEKGTVRFPLAGAVPVQLITRFAELRAKEAASPKPKAKKRAR